MAYSAKKGLNPARKVGSAPDSAGLTAYSIASAYGTALAKGDPVKLTTDGTLIQATNGADAIGVLESVSYVDSAGKLFIDKYWPASQVATDIVALVKDDPNATFIVKGNGPIPLVQPGDIFALVLAAPSASTKSSNVVADVLAVKTGDVDIDAMTDLGENLTGADDGDSFTIKTSAPGASAVTIAIADGDGYDDLVTKINAVPNISATTTSAGLLQITATDGYDIVSAAGTGALWDDLFAGTVGTFSQVVASNAGLVKVIRVVDADSYAMECVLVNHSLRDDG